MPDTPDRDPLDKVIGVLRSAADDLARLAGHPTVKNLVGGLMSALGRDEPTPPAAEATRPPAGARRQAPAKAGPAVKAKPAAGPAARAAAPITRPGGRREQLLEIIRARPGVSIPAAAEQLGVAPGGLYRVARALEADGLLRKEGTGWHPAG